MRGIFFAILLLLGLSNSLSAQVTTIPVRAGEHADYTRLAISLPADIAWTFTQNGTRATLRLTGGLIRFDTTQTFARIPRSRLSSVEVKENTLELRLSCDCPIRAAEDLPQMLVLDILQPSSDARPPSSAVIRPRPRPQREAAPLLAQQAGRRLAQSTREDRHSVSSHPSLVDQLFPVSWAIPKIESLNEGETATLTPDQDLGPQAIEALGAAIAIAVGHGLLAPASPPTHERYAALHREQTRRVDGAAPETSGQNVANLIAQIGVSDSVARARNSGLIQTIATSAKHCPNASAIALDQWQPAKPEQVLPVPTAIFTEQNKLDPAALRDAVRHLLYWGMGSEAALLLSLDPTEHADDQILRSLAVLVDHPSKIIELPNSNGLRECGNLGALWAALAILPDQLGTDFPAADAVQGISMLPQHLRRHLGPFLLTHLFAQGYTTEAHALNAALSRVVPDEGSMSMVVARQVFDYHNTTTPETDLTDIPMPEDLLSLLQNIARTDLNMPMSLIDAAISQIFALRGSREAEALGTLLIRLLGRQGEYDVGFRLLDNQDLRLSTDQIRTGRTELLQALVRNADAADFLMYVFRADPWGNPVEMSLAMELASRLDELGFTQKSRALRELTALGSDADQARQDAYPREALPINTGLAPTTPALRASGDTTNFLPPARMGGDMTNFEQGVTATTPPVSASELNTMSTISGAESIGSPDGGISVGSDIRTVGSAQPMDVAPLAAESEPVPAGLSAPITPSRSGIPETDRSDADIALPTEGVSQGGNMEQQISPDQDSSGAAPIRQATGLLSAGRQAVAESQNLRARLDELLAPAP